MVVVPAERPRTTPLVETEPTARVELVHVPPELPVADKVAVPATQTFVVPLIVPGLASAVMVICTTCVAVLPPASVHSTVNASTPAYPIVGV